MREGTAIADRFLIESEVGSGGMGTVYRAHDRKRDLPVAVKVLARYEARDVERFNRETSLLAEMSDPGIVGYVSHGKLPNQSLYYVMDWIDGTTLNDFIANVGATVAEAVHIVKVVARALRHAHARGILHRDLKPSNIMLDEGDVAKPKLIDFGLARRMRDSIRLTLSGNTIGTPGYMAPEQVRGEHNLDTRADLFALGCLLYEMLAGTPAFAGGNWLLVQSRILLATPPPLPAGTPPELVRLVDGLLAKEAQHRIADAATVVAALEALPPIGQSPRRSPRGIRYEGTMREQPAWRFPAEASCYVVAVLDHPPDEIEQHVEPFGAELIRVEDGALVIRVPAGPDEGASGRARQCAEALRELAPRAPIAIASSAGALEAATREVLAAEMAIVFGREVPAIRVL